MTKRVARNSQPPAGRSSRSFVRSPRHHPYPSRRANSRSNSTGSGSRSRSRSQVHNNRSEESNPRGNNPEQMSTTSSFWDLLRSVLAPSPPTAHQSEPTGEATIIADGDRESRSQPTGPGVASRAEQPGMACTFYKCIVCSAS